MQEKKAQQTWDSKIDFWK